VEDRDEPVGPGEAVTEGADAPAGRPRLPVLRIALVVVAVAVVAFLLLRSGKSGDAARAAAAKSKAAPAIPVVGADPTEGDLPVSLAGLGTVTPLSTVTVRSRVDGQLVSVAFKEGQVVSVGERLAEIDPRPFQVQLTQAQGQLAKDQAALKNAKLDFDRFKTL